MSCTIGNDVARVLKYMYRNFISNGKNIYCKHINAGQADKTECVFIVLVCSFFSQDESFFHLKFFQ